MLKRRVSGCEDATFDALRHTEFTRERATRVQTSVTCENTTLASCSLTSNVGFTDLTISMSSAGVLRVAVSSARVSTCSSLTRSSFSSSSSNRAETRRRTSPGETSSSTSTLGASRAGGSARRRLRSLLMPSSNGRERAAAREELARGRVRSLPPRKLELGAAR
eukprot:31413-Pelagococcus_subviridis.AAC.1